MNVHQFDTNARRLPPTLFLSHGAPTLLLDDCPTSEFLRAFGPTLERPRAILMISAHWEAGESRLLGASRPDTLHDFYGFPPALYAMRYPAPGATALIETLQETLTAAGFKVLIDDARGYDHGVWVPLKLMFPAADIPIAQVSINPDQSPLHHWRLGRALGMLRNQGVLVVGSGSITHNLGDFRSNRAGSDTPVMPYAQEFVEWFDEALTAQATDRLLAYRTQAPHAARAHPTDEHLLPLFVALGAAGVAWTATRIHQGFMYGAIGMDAYLFHSSPLREAAR